MVEKRLEGEKRRGGEEEKKVIGKKKGI